MNGMLGWRKPDDRRHELRYALAPAMPQTPTPVVLGIPWYTAFDAPVKGADGAWWIGLADRSWGSLRGGHAICARPPSIPDVGSAWVHYNQGSEGACVGFAVSRALTLYNRRLYSGRDLYLEAQRRDPWPGEEPTYSGTSVNAGLDTARLVGGWPVRAGVVQPPRLQAGITAFLWAMTPEEVAAALKTTEGFVRLLNSWGRGYPREVRLPLDALPRLIAEGGEFGVPVDRLGRG